MGSDERPSTRDIASPSGAETDPRFEHDTAAAERPSAAEPDADAAQPTPQAVTPAPTAHRSETVESDRSEMPSRAGTAATDHDNPPLLPDGEGLQSQWEEIQVRFVDEPRGAVEDADALVATVMQRLAEGFAQERERLEAQWGRGEDISTEDLRVALQRYRSFFQRLLAT